MKKKYKNIRYHQLTVSKDKIEIILKTDEVQTLKNFAIIGIPGSDNLYIILEYISSIDSGMITYSVRHHFYRLIGSSGKIFYKSEISKYSIFYGVQMFYNNDIQVITLQLNDYDGGYIYRPMIYSYQKGMLKEMEPLKYISTCKNFVKNDCRDNTMEPLFMGASLFVEKDRIYSVFKDYLIEPVLNNKGRQVDQKYVPLNDKGFIEIELKAKTNGLSRHLKTLPKL